MALNLTTAQRAMMRESRLKVRVLSTWYMDDGTYRYCDDIEDITIGGTTWIGAAALAAVSEIKSSTGNMSAEPVVLTIDGTRMYQAGFSDPAGFFNVILSLPLSNRRVDLMLAVGRADDPGYSLVLPLFAGKINNAKLVDPRMPAPTEQASARPESNLQITLDSLAARYSWSTMRTRTHEDQLEIDPTDMFFSYVHMNMKNEQTLYWGKKAPTGSQRFSSYDASMIYLMTGGRLDVRGR